MLHAAALGPSSFQGEPTLTSPPLVIFMLTVAQARFAILKCLLRDGDGALRVNCDPDLDKLTVSVDRSRIASHAKVSIGNMLLRLHMYRCTADVQACRPYYEDLSAVEGYYLEWRRIVLSKKQPRLNYVHANTFLRDNQVVLKEYAATNEGIVQSWAERGV
jgi:dipeptidyl-peptidase III